MSSTNAFISASVSGSARTAITRERTVGNRAPGSLEVRMTVVSAGRLLEQLEERVRRLIRTFLRHHAFGVADDEHLPPGHRRLERRRLNDRADRGDEDSLVTAGWLIQAAVRQALGDPFGHVLANVGQVRVGGAFEPWAREKPMQIGVLDRLGQLARATMRPVAGSSGGLRPVGFPDGKSFSGSSQSNNRPSQRASCCLPTPRGPSIKREDGRSPRDTAPASRARRAEWPCSGSKRRGGTRAQDRTRGGAAQRRRGRWGCRRKDAAIR